MTVDLVVFWAKVLIDVGLAVAPSGKLLVLFVPLYKDAVGVVVGGT